MSWRIRENEACDDVAGGLWDTVLADSGDQGIDLVHADWAMDGKSKGLAANAALHTAVILCLFTDRRLPDDEPTPDGSPDRRGWLGDSFDIDEEAGERDLGSLLWTLDRGKLDWETERLAEQYALEALQTLIDQGAVASIEVEATSDAGENAARGGLFLTVRLFSESGEKIYEQRFASLWKQIEEAA